MAIAGGRSQNDGGSISALSRTSTGIRKTINAYWLVDFAVPVRYGPQSKSSARSTGGASQPFGEGVVGEQAVDRSGHRGDVERVGNDSVDAVADDLGGSAVR